MSQVTERVKQESPKTRTRPSLPALSKVTIMALLGLAVIVTANFLIVWLIDGAFIPEFFVGIVPALIVVGLVAGRLRWAPAVGAVAALLTMTLYFLDPNGLYILTHPGIDLIDYLPELLALAFALAVIVVGIGATVQNYRGGQPRPQHWLQPFLVGFTGIVVGMLIITALVAANPVTSSASSTTNGVPTVHLTTNNFAQNVVLVPRGDKLLIVDDASVEHILQNGMWTANGVARPLTEPGAPIVHNVDITGGSVAIGPFNTAGIFHIYCTVHPGMNLTIVVE